MNPRSLRGTLLGLALGACTPAPVTVTPAAQVTGTIGGVEVATVDTAMIETAGTRDGQSVTLGLFIRIEGKAGVCERVKNGELAASIAGLTLTMGNDKGDRLKAGTYPIFAGDHVPGNLGNYSRAMLSSTGAACEQKLSGAAAKAAEGAVVLTALSEGASATGTFDLTVDGQKVTGSFAANLCAGSTEAMLTPAAPACK